jgi:hypothetical protein
MWNAATGGSSMQTESEVDNHGSVVVNLQSLIGHIQASIALVEAAVASEFCDGNRDAAAESSCWTTSRRLTRRRMRR